MARSPVRSGESSTGPILATVLAAVTVAMVGFYLWRSWSAPAPEDRTTVAPVRLSGTQALLNWQSFRGRSVIVEFCTIRVPASGPIQCRIIDGSREVGGMTLDRETLDPASAEWARRTCSGSGTAPRACSVRVAGILRKGLDATPLLEKAKIEQ